MSGTARIYQWFGDESDPATNPPAAVAAEASGAAAPTNGQQLRRRIRGFDAGTDEGIFLVFVLPSNYSSGGTLTFQWSANATSGDVIWKTAYALATFGTTDFDGVAFGTVTAASAQTASGTAGVEVSKTIDLGVTGATAGQRLYVYLGRDADNIADTMTGDAELVEPWLFTFTTV
jgi:hypothetical protein